VYSFAGSIVFRVAIMTKPGWGAVILGDETDLEDWAGVLQEPFDPWVERHDTRSVLRSASLDELDAAVEVRARATAQIERLNGAISLSRGAKPVRFGGVIQFTADGKQHTHIFAEMGVFESRDKLHATAFVVGPDGNPIASSPQPSEVQQWATAAESDDLLEDALVYFGRATNWFDIYKTLECLILRFGPGYSEFLKRSWADETKIELLKRTANWARHAKRKFPPPPKPMTLNDAHSLLAQLFRQALASINKS
jgi:hypothetical protein